MPEMICGCHFYVWEDRSVDFKHCPTHLAAFDFLDALKRLSSMEAFKLSRVVDVEHDAELLVRIDYARTVLEKLDLQY